MLRYTLTLLLALSTVTTEALAGCGRWSIDKNDDPFSKGKTVSGSYATSVRSGVFMSCDTAKAGLEIRVISGWRMSAEDELKISLVGPKMAVAIDGQILFEDQDVAPGRFGNSIAGITSQLTPNRAEKVLNAFVKAKRQIAIKDGISNKPHLLKARGSTKTAKALLACLNQQN